MGVGAIDKLFSEVKKNTEAQLRIAWLLENIILPKENWKKLYANELALSYLGLKNASARRILGKTLASTKIPKQHHDELYDFAIKLIGSSEEPVASKYHAVNIACEVAKLYPDLFVELLALLEVEKEKNSIAFAMAHKRVLKAYKKLKQ